MIHTKETIRIENLSGIPLDREVALALGWKCVRLHGPDGLEGCPHAAQYGSNYYAAFVLRLEMQKLGWESEDRLTWMGWGDQDKPVWGYSFWFSRWIKHEKCTLHSSVPDAQHAPLAVARCALVALTQMETGLGGPFGDIEKAFKKAGKKFEPVPLLTKAEEEKVGRAIRKASAKA